MKITPTEKLRLIVCVIGLLLMGVLFLLSLPGAGFSYSAGADVAGTPVLPKMLPSLPNGELEDNSAPTEALGGMGVMDSSRKRVDTQLVSGIMTGANPVWVPDQDKSLSMGQTLATGEPVGSQRVVTAYSMSRDECDETPTIGAWNDDLAVLQARGIQVCATRLYPRGTKLRIGEIECVVFDRTSEAYADRIDLLKSDKQSAYEWGVKTLSVSEVE